MPINYPRLDDRDFESLLKSACDRLKEIKPEWSGVDLSDPGVVLLELFAYLTEEVLYRVNKLPEKTYVEFLNLLEASPAPPSAASTDLVFTLKDSVENTESIEIPAHTQVSLSGGGSGSLVFLTVKKASLNPEENRSVTVRAVHCSFVENEPCGKGSGEPGFTVTVKNKPIVADPLGELSTSVAVEITENQDAASAIVIDGKSVKLWKECERKSDLNYDKAQFMVEKASGTIRFPLKLYTFESDRIAAERAGLAHHEKEIFVSYYHGGGSQGNVSANSLTVLLDPRLSERLLVNNPQPATGGRDAETVDELIQRGPDLIHSTERLITAQDYNIELSRCPGIAQVDTYAKTELWPFAERGVVEVALVPMTNLRPWDQPELVTSDTTLTDEYAIASKAELLSHVAARIDAKKVLGITVACHWARIKTIAVDATVIIYPKQSPQKIKREILKALYAYFAIEPRVPGSAYSLSVSNTINTAELYALIMGIKGVRHVSKMFLRLPKSPDTGVRSIERCAYMPGYYLAASEDGLYFSINNGEDWQQTIDTAGEAMVVSRAHPDKSGFFALITQETSADDSVALESLVRVSTDNGNTWNTWKLAMAVYDCAWADFEDETALVLAAEDGLYWLGLTESSLPRYIDVTDYDGGFYRVVASYSDANKRLYIAAAAMNCAGVRVLSSMSDNQHWDYLPAILKGRDIRALTLETSDARIWLWAGATTTGDLDGDGCFRCELTSGVNIAKTLIHYRDGWSGGSCRCLLIDGATVYAGTHRRGILRMNTEMPTPQWETLPLECGLPLRDVERLFVPVNGLERGQAGIVAATDAGIYSGDAKDTYKCLSGKQRYANVSIPKSWFFCSGLHQIKMEEFSES